MKIAVFIIALIISLECITKALKLQDFTLRPARRAVLKSERRSNPSLLGLTAGRRVFEVLDETLQVDLTERSDLISGPGRFYTGTVVGEPHSEVQLVVNGDGVSGSVRQKGQILQILAEGMGISQETKMDPSKFRDEKNEAPAPAAPRGASMYVHQTPFNISQRQVDTTVVEWCVFYTDAALADAGGLTGMRNKIQAMEGDANTGYKNSGLDTRARTVFDASVDFDEDRSTWDRTLSLFTDTSDGEMDEVHDIRVREGCDGAILLIAPTDDGSTAGIAWVGSRFDTMFAVSESRFAQSGVNAHEVGHNFGCAHDASTGGSGIDSWSNGYVNTAEEVVTVMAYACAGCTSLSVHSMPVTFEGMVVGNSRDADCTRTVGEQTATISSFLPSNSGPSRPVDPTDAPTDSPDPTELPTPTSVDPTDAPTETPTATAEGTDTPTLAPTLAPLPTGTSEPIEETLAPEDPGVRECRDKGPSEEDGKTATLTISNGKRYGIQVIFIQFDGSEQYLGTLPSGMTATLSARLGYRLRLRNDDTGACLRSMVVRKRTRTVNIGRR